MRRTSQPLRSSAFTLLELLIVMAIIIVLAGLIIGTSGYVQKKGARSRAEAEIAAMSAALESYKADNGVYPHDSQGNATSVNPTSAAENERRTSSQFLYGELSGDRDFNGTTDPQQRSYFSFKPQMLGPRSSTGTPTTVQYIRDPFGNSYGYSTLKATNPSASGGYNPTFDLWSTGGTEDSAAAANVAQWIKNW
jgi:general secretion pathway protein G